MSHKKKISRPPYTERIATPIIQKGKDGSAELWCPFCQPSHILSANNQNGCGSDVQMRVVQMVYKAKYNDKMICVKCGKGGGEMVKYLNAMIHVPDCNPEIATFIQPPPTSKLAKYIYKLPGKIKPLAERFTGVSMPIEEVSPDGKRTGEILGYFFKRRKSNGKRITQS